MKTELKPVSGDAYLDQEIDVGPEMPNVTVWTMSREKLGAVKVISFDDGHTFFLLSDFLKAVQS